MSALAWLLSLSLVGSEPAPPAPPELVVPDEATAEAGFVAGALAIQLRQCGASPDQLDAFYRHERGQSATTAQQAAAFSDGFQRGSQYMHGTLSAGDALPDATLCQALWTRLPSR